MPLLRHAVLATSVCIVLFAAAGCGSPSTVRVERVWIRAADSGATTAAYFTLINDTADTLHVTGVSGDVAEALSLHETLRAGGMVAMRETSRLAVPPHARLAFAPGGHHVMLAGLRRKLLPGMHVNLALHARNWPEVPLVAEVRP